MAREALLSVDDLRVEFWTSRGTVHAVNGISFDIAPGETLGIVGESGCGKSVTSLAILGLLARAGRVSSGSAVFDGRDLIGLSDPELRRIRGKEIAMIFQDPMTSLNPVHTVGTQIREALTTHFDMTAMETDARVIELLDQVGIPSAKSRAGDYPHQFSGGMRQRSMIAMALACEPKLLIADEPTTALDVTIQAQILDLLRALVTERGTALILITHDLGVVAGMCERVNVMYAGTLVETGTADQIFGKPRHPYTLGLLQSMPRLDVGRQRALQPISGQPRDMLSPPTDCPFASRCHYRLDICTEQRPQLESRGHGQRAACFNPVHPDEWKRALVAEHTE
ncbi:MAG: ABC transporter ATP-binding protein [Actinobacteria bacterium]|nr:ABC transporter ATP-binding protein [Actinomycetota bacterium]